MVLPFSQCKQEVPIIQRRSSCSSNELFSEILEKMQMVFIQVESIQTVLENFDNRLTNVEDLIIENLK